MRSIVIKNLGNEWNLRPYTGSKFALSTFPYALYKQHRLDTTIAYQLCRARITTEWYAGNTQKPDILELNSGRC